MIFLSITLFVVVMTRFGFTYIFIGSLLPRHTAQSLVGFLIKTAQSPLPPLPLGPTY